MAQAVLGLVKFDKISAMRMVFEISGLISAALTTVPSPGSRHAGKNARFLLCPCVIDPYFVVEFVAYDNEIRRLFVFFDYGGGSEAYHVAGSPQFNVLFHIEDWGHGKEIIQTMLDQFPGDDRWIGIGDEVCPYKQGE
jgi:hypothetical protein